MGFNALTSLRYEGSSVSIVTGHKLDVQHSAPSSNTELSLYSTPTTTNQWLLGAHTSDIKWLQYEAYNSLPSSAAVNNLQSYAFTLPYVSWLWHLIKYRYNITFAYKIVVKAVL
jgi:hypothetical protein